MNIDRLLKLDLPPKQSAFLWGARKTGKSTYLKQRFAASIYYDLLKTDDYLRLLAKPYLLREELLAANPEQLKFPIVIDEIQKIPLLLNEVHWLIENKKMSFILCGSSARQLKRGAANLLGGRAWRFHFYPLVYKEITDFDLIRAMNHGLIPAHYLSDQYKRMLRAYMNDYLKEEIQAEGIVRHLPKFSRFIDLIGFSHGEMLNYTNIARDCGVDAKTVKEYYQILVDTLLGYFIYPYFKKAKRELVQATPRFYLFDMGIANYLAKKTVTTLQGDIAGDTFEHFILTELMAYQGLHEIDSPINYWRSKTGLEVDFLLNDGEIAIEVKLSSTPTLNDLKGLRAFCEDHAPKQAYVVCNAPNKRILGEVNGIEIEVMPWKDFLDALWSGKIIS